MLNEPELFAKYLKHLKIEKEQPSIEYLSKLQTAQLIKFPFENISKIILHFDNKLIALVDFETHLNNSIKFGFGGTCYACNYYFNRLLSYLGYAVNLHGADMGSARDVHVVNIVTFGEKRYLVDVGYGAPFYSPVELVQSKTEIKWGSFIYTITEEKDCRIRLSLYKGTEKVHGYIVNNTQRSIGYFNRIIAESFRHGEGFMRMLRIIRYFSSYSIELKNLEYSIHRNGGSIKHQISSIDELEQVISCTFKLPSLPIRRVYEILYKNS